MLLLKSERIRSANLLNNIVILSNNDRDLIFVVEEFLGRIFNSLEFGNFVIGLSIPKLFFLASDCF